MNTRLAEYLVEEKGFTRICIESGFPESKKANDYILGADIEKTDWTNGINKMFSRWEEFNDMIEWLRNYNAKVSDDKKVQFYGIDITGGYDNLLPAYTIIKSYLEIIDPAYGRRIEKAIYPLLKSLNSDKPHQARNRFIDSLTLEQNYELRLQANLIIKHFTENKTQYLKKSKLSEYEFAKQSSIALFQALNYFNESANWNNNEYRTTVGITGRDIAMFQNFSWVHKQDTTAKIVIICHNVHSKTRSGYLDDNWKFFIPFGAFVKQYFGDQYYAIGAAYNDGVYWDNWKKNEPRLIKNTPPAKKGEIDYTLKEVNKPNFFIDFRNMNPRRPAFSWLQSKIMMREHDEQSQITPDEFHGYIYYDTISIPTENK
jgi:Erythromycin esterase homolog